MTTPRRYTRPACLLSLAVFLAAALTGCGSSSSGGGDPVAQVPQRGGLQQRIADAQRPAAADFPAPGGRTLARLASAMGARSGGSALATSVFVSGERNRLAFGTVDRQTRFIYGRSAVYVAPRTTARALGPFPAPADVLLTAPAFRSKQAATEADPFAAVYAARVPFRRPGTWSILTVTKQGRGWVAGTRAIRVVTPAQDPIPEVGERAPKVATDTPASAGGLVQRIDTRQPPSDLHRSSFADVVGRKPVALLFATPQLCQSRVCGPVVDIALQLRERYGDRMEFIHQEVYRDNDPQKGLRPPLGAFRLQTEPWLFVVGRDGRITARLEGSFGLRAFEDAVKTAL